MNTLSASEDPFELPGFISRSPCDGHLLPALQEISADKDFRRFERRWRRQANVTWSHPLYDCILTARCSGRVPSAISEDVADEAPRKQSLWRAQKSQKRLYSGVSSS